MGAFEWEIKDGHQFKIEFNDEPKARDAGFYSFESKMEIINAWIDDLEFPKDSDGKLYFMKVVYTYEGETKVLIIDLGKDALKFFNKITKEKAKRVYIKCSPEFTSFYETEFKLRMEAAIQAVKNAKLKALQDMDAQLIDDTVLKLSYNTSYKWHISREGIMIEEWVSVLNKTGHFAQDRLEPFQSDCDMGDYTLTYFYEAPFGKLKEVFVGLKAEVERIEAEKEVKERETKTKAEEKRKVNQEAKEKAFQEEILFFGTEFLASVNFRLLHSLGAQITRDNKIQIFTHGNSRFMKDKNPNTTFTIKDTLKGKGFRWNGENKAWEIDNTEDNQKLVIEHLKKYDTKADPHELGLQQCWECGTWHYQRELDSSGYCGC